MSPPRGVHGPFTLAVCALMVFRDHPLPERVRRLTALDVQVRIWDSSATTSRRPSSRSARRGRCSPR